ncbi:MAG: hypothetical protein HRF46_12665 [Acidobacteriota bacterium]|jgi:hypothetical protein
MLDRLHPAAHGHVLILPSTLPFPSSSADTILRPGASEPPELDIAVARV